MMTRLQWMTACGLLGATALPGLAADQYWDANGATAGLGGTGVWSTVDSNWNDATGTGAPAAWTNGNSAIFDGTAGTVSISGGVTAENVHFLVDGYIVQNSTLTLSGAATITVSPGVTATINSTIGTLGSPLIITGGGTLVMGGSGHNGGIDDNLEIHDGTLLADKSGTAGIKDGGRIIIGDGVGALGSAVVRVIGTSTNPLRSLITLRPDGLLDYNGKNLSVENLLFSGGGQVELGGATLNLMGPLNNPFPSRVIITVAHRS